MNRRRRRAKITDRVKEWTARLANVFGERIGLRTSESALSERMGQSRGFVNKVKAHARGGRIADLLHSLEALGDEMPTDLLHQAFEQVPVDAVAVLSCSRQRQSGLKPNRFLERFGPRLRALIEQGPTPGNWRSQGETLRAFEKLRFNDRELSRAKLEFFVGTAVSLLEKLGSRPQAAFADLACALGSLAAAHRVGGRRDDALDLLLLAHPLAILSDDPLAEGSWYQKAAFLLVDLGRCDRAYEFVQEAAMLFFVTSGAGRQAELQVDLAYVLCHAGRGSEALKVLKRVLPLVPTNDRETLLSAHQLRAIEFRKLGRYAEASEELGRAMALAVDGHLGSASLHWSKAKLAILMKDSETALQSFQEAIKLHLLHGNTADVAELTFDYAEFLLGENRRSELRALVDTISCWASEIKGSRRVREVLENFVALDELRKLDAASIIEVRKGLPRTTKAAPKYRRNKPQPCGGKISPASSSSGDLIRPFGGDCSPESSVPLALDLPPEGGSS